MGGADPGARSLCRQAHRNSVVNKKPTPEELRARVFQWLEEGKSLQYSAPARPSTPFEQHLIEKARKQGLVI